MDNEKKIEIPFGAFDSELIRQEIKIPKGFNATIEGDKIILTRAESEDEEIKKAMINFFKSERKEGDVVLHYGVNIESMIAWLEKQDEQKPILNVPTREVILSIWDLGNEWKELTNGCISTEYGTQLDYIQKHWRESEYYLREKQGKQKPPIEMKTPEESLGIDSDTYNEIVDECIYGEQKPIEWDEYDEMYVSALIAIVEKDGATGKNLRDGLTGKDLRNELIGWLRCLKGRFLKR